MGMTCIAAIVNGDEGVNEGVRVREICGEIDSCLKLDSRVLNEWFKRLVESDEGVV
jgi:hypothetical protein